MGRKQIAVVCESCESPLRSDSPFCSSCGKPTRWATHDERVAWEVRQWRESRQGTAASRGTMMLVRTEAGYEPAPMFAEQYIWDQPLHADRDPANGHAPAAPAAAAGTAAPEPVAPEPVAPEPVASEPVVAELPVAEPGPAPKPVAPMPFATTTPAAPSEPVHHVADDGDHVTISKKAVAVGIALALGLPLGSRMLAPSSTASRPPAAAPARAAGPITPLALAPARSGFVQVSPDAVRFAVVIRNPNRRLAARDTDVVVTFHDRAGRLIGTAVERLASVPAGRAFAVAGQTGVSARVASLRSRVSVAGFADASNAPAFVVRGTSVSRSRNALVVRTSVAARRGVRGARVVVVHFDRAGRILGGDFTYVDVPAMPRSVPVLVSTSGMSASIRRVEVYVLDPR